MKKIISAIFIILFAATLAAQDLMTIGEVFDFAIGDEFQIAGFAYGQPPNADRITITDKFYSPDSNTVFYVEYHDSYYSYIIDWDSLGYKFWTETDTVSYTNLDSSITTYRWWVPYDTLMESYDTVITYSEYYCGALINGYDYAVGSFEPVYHSKDYGRGLGLVRDYFNDPAEFSEYENKLFYYQKDGVSCGTPDLTTSVGEMTRKDNIRVFPNPATDHFTIENNSRGSLNIKIFDDTGKLLDSQNVNTGKTFYDCSSFSPGLYFIRFASKSKSYYEKLIIN